MEAVSQLKFLFLHESGLYQVGNNNDGSKSITTNQPAQTHTYTQRHTLNTYIYIQTHIHTDTHTKYIHIHTNTDTHKTHTY